MDLQRNSIFKNLCILLAQTKHLKYAINMHIYLAFLSISIYSYCSKFKIAKAYLKIFIKHLHQVLSTKFKMPLYAKFYLLSNYIA